MENDVAHIINFSLIYLWVFAISDICVCSMNSCLELENIQKSLLDSSCILTIEVDKVYNQIEKEKYYENPKGR